MANNFKATKFTTDVTGRFLFGDVYEPETEDFDGNPLVIKSGPNKGKPTVHFVIGLATPKRPGETHFSQSILGAIVWAQGHRDHPATATREDFSWKATDGDSAKVGKPFRGKPGRAPKDIPGYPGNWVFRFGGAHAVKVIKSDLTDYIRETGVVQLGDSIQVVGSCIGNEGATPGVYLNYEGIIWNGMHPLGRIVGVGLDLAKLREDLAGQARPTFVAPPDGPAAPPPPPAANAGAAPPPPPPPAANAAPPPPPPPSVGVVPAAGFMPPPPPPSAPPPPPPPPAGPVMTSKAGGNSYAAMIASGWTDVDLRAHGYMI